MTRRIVLAVDGGNSKTDLALVSEDGSALALRGPRSTPQYLGVDGFQRAEELLDDALREAGLVRANGPFAEIAELLLAGVDFRSDEEEMEAAAAERGWAARAVVENDTSPCCAQGPIAAGESQSSAAPASTASALLATAATLASRHSARSPATGEAAMTSGSPE